MRRLPATTVYYGQEFVLSLPSYIFTAVFLVRDLNMSPLQLILMGTVMEATVFAFEVPTSIVADTYSRRLSVIVSMFIQGGAIVLVGLAPSPTVAIVAWGIWGVGWTFMSGAWEAWITDEVGAANVGPVFLRATRISFVAAFVGLVLQTAVALESLRASVVVGGALTIACGIASIFVMPEAGFRRRPREERSSPAAELRTTAVTGARFVRAQPLLLLMIAITFFEGMSTEAVDRLWEAHFIRDIGLPALWSLDPVVWFALFGIPALPIGYFAAGRLAKRFDDAQAPRLARTLLVLTALMMAAQLAFGLATAIALAYLSLLVYRVARSMVYPLYMTWMNQQITDSSVRATVISITNQSDAIGQTLGGPGLGVIGNVWGIRAALCAGAVVLAPALGLYGRALRHGGREPELA
ncbi:MAG: MFS transporter, partial [Actinomycetota bacterium]|nr:MFS transporter [Actinomycetota bacterium]